MKVFVQSINFNADKELVKYITEKIESLEKYYDKIIDSEAYLKVNQSNDKENKTIEIKINIPKDELLVSKTGKTFEEATNSAIEALRRMLTKKKQMQRGYQM